ncbi:MAG: hypothetical protein HYZ53_04850 [Planctomycetes bacterium]|nr:hypothetical protein [Planctomycetota bacterium]
MLDDLPAIAENPTVRASAGAVELLGSPYWNRETPHNGYRPVVLASYAADWHVGSGDPFHFHATNLVLHLAATLLVAWLGASLLESRLAGLFSGLLFAVHPLHAEAVAHISGRSDLLATTLLLAALAARAAGRGRRARTRVLAEAAALLAFGLALLSKETAAVGPALALLVDAALERSATRSAAGGVDRRAWARRQAAPLACWLAVLAGCILLRGAVLGTLSVEFRAFEELGLAPAERARVAFSVLADELKLFFFPDPLLAQRAVNLLPLRNTGPAGAAAGGALLVLGLPAVLAGSLRRGRGTVAASAAWTAIALLPASNLLLPIGVLQADRLLYLPSVGIAWLLGDLAARAWSGPGPSPAAAPPPGLAGPARLVYAARVFVVALCAASFGATAARNEAWQTRADLYADCLLQEPENPWTHAAASRLLLEEGRMVAAEAAATRALELLPSYPLALEARGLARMGRGLTAEALEDLTRARFAAPTARRIMNRGVLLATAGRAVEAETELRAAAAAAPGDAEVLNALGAFLAAAHREEEALPLLERAARRDPAHAAIRANLGLARLALGDLRGLGDLREAVARAGADAGVLFRAGAALVRAGAVEEGIAALERASRSAAAPPGAHDALGLALVRAGRPGEARRVAADMKAAGLRPTGEFARWLDAR